jgi:hypothetical protein
MGETDNKNCGACGTSDSEKPMCFQGEPWCSDDCRKLMQGEINGTTFTIVSGKAFNQQTGLYDVPLDVATRKRYKKVDEKRRVRDSSSLT